MGSVQLFLLALAAVLILAGLYHYGRQPRRRRQARTRREDAVKYVFQCRVDGEIPTVVGLARALQWSPRRAAAVLSELAADELLAVDQARAIHLTDAGCDLALHVVRAHRLWEQHLAENTGHAQVDWHTLAEAAEHDLTPAAADALAQQLGHPVYDPHGDPIPQPARPLPPRPAVPLDTLAPGTVGRIIHVEDEPPAAYAQLVAGGVVPGMEAWVTAADNGTLRVHVGSEDLTLPRTIVAQIHVAPQPDAVPNGVGVRLSDLTPGAAAVVRSVTPACRGLARRRLFDLGLLPGTRIDVVFASPGGDPVAYRVRDTVIALRREQTRHILVEPVGEAMMT